MRLACVNRRSPSFTAHLGLMAMAFYANAIMPTDVFAWENNCSHPRITQNAVSLLNASGNGNVPASPFFSEFVLYDPSIEAGVQAEDKPDIKKMRTLEDENLKLKKKLAETILDRRGVPGGLDYAAVPMGELGSTHRFTLGARW